jgi:hypothetical protein
MTRSEEERLKRLHEELRISDVDFKRLADWQHLRRFHPEVAERINEATANVRNSTPAPRTPQAR